MGSTHYHAIDRASHGTDSCPFSCKAIIEPRHVRVMHAVLQRHPDIKQGMVGVQLGNNVQVGYEALPTLRKKDSRDLSYPAAAAPRFLGMLVSILALCRVQLDPTKHRLASPSCTAYEQHSGNSVGLQLCICDFD